MAQLDRPDVPVDAAAASIRLSGATVPTEILEVAQRLQDRGHAAVLVGGAVRDVLLGLPADDWDLATSARPEEVQAAFRRTIPTGIEHGTVTVLVRPAADAPREGHEAHVPVEVTTFRGEGAYIDGRRPSAITFLRDLIEDLARRDFTVNAFAWDPIARRFDDPFDGLADLRAGVLRAVGDPARRFGEDGLRTMRAVRLCATRSLRLEPGTEAAIAGALEVLAKVSRERVHVELVKLLGAPQPSAGLVPMAQTGIWPLVLPPLPEPLRSDAIAAVDRLSRDAVLRLARLLWPVVASARSDITAALDGLRHGRADRARLDALLGPGAQALVDAAAPVEIRRAAAALGRAHVDDVGTIAALDEGARARVAAALHGAALTVDELALRARDLIARGLATPGPALGGLVRRLLDAVLEDPTLNEPERLAALARR
ncbi:MAG: hypothetical protein K1X88_26475 [Nannocystaceae bacterium]|nr:hypothetical protein [Nannocystaceae bacterium]